MSFLHDGVYVSEWDVPDGMKCFEIQLWRSFAPSSLSYDEDDEFDSDPESDDVDDGDEYSMAQAEVVLIGYEVAEDKHHALELALARIGAPSMEHLLDSLSSNPNMQCHLEAQEDESKFGLGFGYEGTLSRP